MQHCLIARSKERSIRLRATDWSLYAIGKHLQDIVGIVGVDLAQFALHGREARPAGLLVTAVCHLLQSAPLC